MILAGIGLLLLSGLLDIGYDFASLDNRPTAATTRVIHLLEHLMGYLGSGLLLFIGFRRWLSAANEEQQDHQRLMDAIARAQGSFINTADTRQAFERLLQDILEMTGSAYGFIGEVLQTDDGQPYLKTRAITNIAWNAETQRFFAEHAPQGMEFTNLNSLFGAVLVSREAVIANDPGRDPRRGGLPPGHPALNAFLGLPICAGGRMQGMVGIANRAGGYNQAVIEFLAPLTSVIAQLIDARHAMFVRQETEKSLQRLSLVASRTTNGVVITDTTGRVEWVNDGFTRISGYTLAEMRGRKPGEVLQGAASDPATLVRIGEAFRRGDSFEAELVNYTKAGHPYWIHLSVDPMLDDDGQLQGFMGIETDISARKSAEASLTASAQHTQAVLDNVLDGIITIDGRGTVASFNQAAERIFGYTAGAVIGRNINMLMPEPHRTRHDGYLRNYQATGVAKVIGIGREVEGQRRDGSLFPMELAVTEIRRDEQPLYIGMVRDITERKRLERMKREFIATVSHELRTPLTSIRGALGLVASGALAAAPAQTEKLIGIAHKNSERLTHLINDLLDMEKMAAGGMRFDMQAQLLMPLIEQSIEAIRSYGAPRDVSFHLVARDDDARVCVDAQRLSQVMANLLSNAAKFSPVGGQVEVSVIRRDQAVRMSVRDHGSGIPAAFQSDIFNKFCQADASDTRQRGGTGLGLAISKELVEHMHGRIGFESREGEGAVFHVDLALEPLLTADVTPAAAEIPGAPRLLVVEDNPEVSALLVLMLQNGGFNVDAALDGETALQRISERRYDAITLDLLLPDRSGVSIIRQLRADAATAQLPIIVLSAHVDGGRLALSGEANAIDWLEKPIDAARLLASVRNAITGPLAAATQLPRVLHVEDDADLHRIVATISRDLAEFDHADTLAEARNCLLRARYDVVLLDIDLPDGSGWELLEPLRALDPPPRIIILSATETRALKTENVTAALVKSRLSNGDLLATLHRLIN